MKQNSLETRQSTTQLFGSDEVFGDGSWQCVGDSCSNPTATGFSSLSCDGNCLHFNLNGGSNAQVGAQHAISSSPLINGGGSFKIGIRVFVYWTPTGSTVSNPTTNVGTVHFLATVAGTTVVFPTTAYDSRYSGSSIGWYPYEYSGFIPDGFSSSTAAITLGFDAGVPTGDGYYSIWIDQLSLTVPTSSPPAQQLANSSSRSAASLSALNSNSSGASTQSQTSRGAGSSAASGQSIPASQSPIAPGSASTTNSGNTSGSNPDTGALAPNVAMILVVIAAVIVALIGMALVCFLIMRRRWRKRRHLRAESVNPFQTPEANSFVDGSDHYLYSAATEVPTSGQSLMHRPVEMTEQEQLRQWMSSPTEILPAYRTSLGSAIPGPIEDAEYDAVGSPPVPRRAMLGLHGPIEEEADEGEAGNDIKRRGTALRYIKR